MTSNAAHATPGTGMGQACGAPGIWDWEATALGSKAAGPTATPQKAVRTARVVGRSWAVPGLLSEKLQQALSATPKQCASRHRLARHASDAGNVLQNRPNAGDFLERRGDAQIL